MKNLSGTPGLFVYMSIMSLAAILGTLKFIVFAKLLSPEDFGLYSLVITTYVFVLYAGSLGFNEALMKLGSIAYGEGNQEFICRLRDLAIVCGLLSTAVMGGLFALGVWLFVDDESIKHAFNLSIVLALAAIGFNLNDAFFRVNQRKIEFSLMLFFKSLTVVILGSVLSEQYGFDGVIFSEIVAFFGIFLIVMLFNVERFEIGRLRGGVALLSLAVKNGFPLLASMFVRKMSLSLDRWIIAASLGLVALAKYAFAMIIYLIAITLLGFITNVLGPQWLSEYGKDGSLRDVFRKIQKLSTIILLLGLISLIPFKLLVPIVLDAFYPLYATDDVVNVMFYVYCGVVVMVATQVFDWFFMAASREKALLRISLYSIFFLGLLLGGASLIEVGVVGYSVIFLIVRVFVAIFYIGLIVKIFQESLAVSLTNRH